MPNRQPRENPVEVLNRPENVERVEKFKAIAEAKEKQVTEVSVAAAKIFDPVALLKRASEIHEFNHPTLGIVRFGELVLNDSAVLERCKTPAAKTAMTLYLMLKKAHPGLPEYTPENILDFYSVFPFAEGAALLQFICEQPSFLPKESLKSGLPSMAEPKI